MGTRLELHGELLDLAPNAYYDPPTSIKMQYPCFVYNRSDIDAIHANNSKYQKFNKYSLTYISRSVSDQKADEILNRFSYCSFDRSYTADGLHHYVFSLYY